MFRNVVAAGVELLSWILVVLLCIGLATLPARAAPSGPAGAWVTAGGGAVIQIHRCGNGLCGEISGMVLTPGDKIPVDWRGRSQCGLVIVKIPAVNVVDGQPAWYGTITNPRDGAVYHVRLTLDGDGSLLLRGYVGLPIFGRTQAWTRYTGALPPDCRLSALTLQGGTGNG